MNSAAIAEIKRRILQTLGFQVNTILPTQLPPVIHETSIKTFRFFYRDRVREGMRYTNKLYASIYEFELRYRLQAYQLAWALFEAQIPLVLSLSPSRFAIWINLQSPIYAVLIRQDARFLKTILSLNLALRKGKVVCKRLSNQS